MSLSIRNQLPGTVTSVTSGEAMATVKVRLAGGQEITAAITADAVKDLGFAEGAAVKALVKSTEVSLATAPVDGLSIRNQIAGTVTDVATGNAMGSVKVSVEGRRADRSHHQGRRRSPRTGRRLLRRRADQVDRDLPRRRLTTATRSGPHRAGPGAVDRRRQARSNNCS